MHLASIRAQFRRHFVQKYSLSTSWSRLLYKRLREMEETGALQSTGHAQMWFQLAAEKPPPARKSRKISVNNHARKASMGPSGREIVLPTPPPSTAVEFGAFSPPASPQQLEQVRDQLLHQLRQIELRLLPKIAEDFEPFGHNEANDFEERSTPIVESPFVDNQADAFKDRSTPIVELLEPPVNVAAETFTVDEELDSLKRTVEILKSEHECTKQMLDLRNAEREHLESSHAAVTQLLDQIRKDLELARQSQNDSESSLRAEIDQLRDSQSAVQSESERKDAHLAQLQSEWSVLADNYEAALEDAKAKLVFAEANLAQMETDAKTISLHLGESLQEVAKLVKESKESAKLVNSLQSLNDGLSSKVEHMQSVLKEVFNIVSKECI